MTASQSADRRPVAVIILAAGMGTRMKSKIPKVMHQVAGMPLIGHVLSAVRPLQAQHTVVVVGHERELVGVAVTASDPQAICVVQEQQRGTGHATQVAMVNLAAAGNGPVVIVSGDSPLITTDDLGKLLIAAQGKAGAVLTAQITDPQGYGRIMRDGDNVERIVEQNDANDQEREISEINSGVYVFDSAFLTAALQELSADNAQGELYLTDVVGILRTQGQDVAAVLTDEVNIVGVNDRKQLAFAAKQVRDRIVDELMLAGVTIIDPSSVWIDSTVVVEADATIHPNVQLHGTTTIAAGASVGPECTLTDTVVGPNAHVIRVTANQAIIGEGAQVGPYTYLRPGTVLGAHAKAGGFVEIKNSTLGPDAKVPHLSYVGDATIGEGSNIGAATVFVNFDGIAKHPTIVGKHVRIGSDTMLVAPVTIGDGAYTAAGSVITEDVPAGAIGVARARQRNIIDWVLRRRPGSASAQAALADSERKS